MTLPRINCVMKLLAAMIALAAGLATEPAFNIVPAYDGLREFALAVRKSPTERDALYQRLVVDAHADACAGAMGSFTRLPADTFPGEALDIVRRIEEGRVRELVESGLKRASAALPGAERTTVCIQPVAFNRAIEHMRGVGGVSLGGRIKIFVHPTIAGFARVEYTAAHEYHHEVARMHLDPGWSRDPLESMIAEGKADAFAVRLFPTLRPPHTDALTPDERRRTWDAFPAVPRSADRPVSRGVHVRACRGNAAMGRLPPRLRDRERVPGTHPDLQVKTWTLLPASEFVEAFRDGRRNSE